MKNARAAAGHGFSLAGLVVAGLALIRGLSDTSDHAAARELIQLGVGVALFLIGQWLERGAST